MGLALEIVPQANPFEPGRNELPVRLLFHDEPLEGALIVAMRKASRGSKTEVMTSVRTDAQGRAMVAAGPGCDSSSSPHGAGGTRGRRGLGKHMDVDDLRGRRERE